jgi:hypothetical protein
MIEKFEFINLIQKANLIKIAKTINELIDEVDRLSKLTEQLVEQDRRQIKLWEGLRDILKK